MKELPVIQKSVDRCPKCAGRKLRNYRTDRLCAELIYRYHVCRACGQRFKIEDDGK